MYYYFLNGNYMGFGITKKVEGIDFILENLEQEKIEKLEKGAKLDYETLEIIEETEEYKNYLIQEKKRLCKIYILSLYSETDQRNCLMWGTDEDKSKMADCIKQLRDERKNNQENADFYKIVENLFAIYTNIGFDESIDFETWKLRNPNLVISEENG